MENSSSVNYFRYNEDASVQSIDPAFVRSQAENWLCSQLFEGLVELNEHLEIVPCLANGWTISEDFKTLIFSIKPNVWFVDAQHKKVKEMNAHDVVSSFLRIVNPQTASPGAWVFNDKIRMDLIESNDTLHSEFPFKAITKDSIQITLSQSFRPMLSLLAMPYCFIHLHNDKGAHFLPLGTGPFTLKAWEKNVTLLMQKNRHYHQYMHDLPLPLLEGVWVDLNKNKQSAFMGFLAGKYHFFNGIYSLSKDELFTQSGALKEKYQTRFHLISGPFLNTEYIGFNLEKRPEGIVDDHDYLILRTCLNIATQRSEIVTFLKNGFGEPSLSGFIPYGLPIYDTYRHSNVIEDPKRAEYLMTQLGFGPQNRLTLSLHTTSDYVDIALLLKNQWSKIFVDLKVEIHQGGFLRQLIKKGDIEMFRGSWIADYPDPENFLACFYSPYKTPYGPNYTRYHNPTFDSIYRISNYSSAPINRYEWHAKADQLLQSDFPVIFLFYDKTVRLTQSNVKGLPSHPMNFLNLKKVHLE